VDLGVVADILCIGLLYSQGYTRDPKLANWVQKQRVEHANMAKGKKCHMTLERLKRLDELGFPWSRVNSKQRNSTAPKLNTTPARTATGDAEDLGQQGNLVSDDDESEIITPVWDGDEGVDDDGAGCETSPPYQPYSAPPVTCQDLSQGTAAQVLVASPESEPTVSVEAQTKRRLIFGKYVHLIACQRNVEHAYKIVRRLTGSIGGNSYVGPIYGELTMTSMQKMVNLMIEHTGLGKDSGFIDVGSGIGKPNIHVAQCPGVAFSCGVEVEFLRWTLGMTNLKAVLQEAVAQQHAKDQGEEDVDEACCLRGNTVFLHKDITRAKTFDPFSHVYMFSIGFPPPLWLELSKMWNHSQSPYLICYHSPKDIIDSYGFDVQLVTQQMTSMHGSREQHMGYIYRRRKSGLKEASTGACDPLFAPSWDLVKKGLLSLNEEVEKQIDTTMGQGRILRSQSKQVRCRMQTPTRPGVPLPETIALPPVFPRGEADDSHDAAEATAVAGDDDGRHDESPVFHDGEDEWAAKVAAEARFEDEWAGSNDASMPNDDDDGGDDPDDEGAKKPRAKRKSVEVSQHTDAEGDKKRKAVAGRGDVTPVVAPQQSEYMPTRTNDGRNVDNQRCSGAPFGCPSKASQCSGRRNCWKWCIGIREKQIQVPENENERQHIIREFRRKMNQRRVAEYRARNK